MKFDSAIKRVFNTDPRAVASYLQYVVSPELLAALELPTLRRIPSDWVSANLVQRFGDSAWVVDYRGDSHTLVVFFHFEFQSRIDPGMPFRMLTYAGLQYEALWKVRSKADFGKGRMPTVISVVLYTGEHRWNVPTAIEAMFEPGSEEIAQYQPSHRYVVVEEVELLKRDEAHPGDFAGALMLLRHHDEADEKLIEAVEFIQENADEESEAYQELANETAKRIIDSNREVRSMKQLKQDVHDMWSNVREQGVEQGMRQGLEQGLEQGMRQGLEKAMRRYLSKRFGQVPSVYDRIIAEADEQQLDDWFDRALSASSIESVFDTNMN